MNPAAAKPVFRSDMTVTLVDSMASDARVIQTAKVSTIGSASLPQTPPAGQLAMVHLNPSSFVSHEELDDTAATKFIDFLMRGRHGSPFEHELFTFLIEAPIFVWREFMRHRIASYNEESGRYKKLAPVFYIPAPGRNLVQTGKAGAYTFEPGTERQRLQVCAVHQQVSIDAYRGYEQLLGVGIAREVARMSLPLNIYSSAYVTMNARALMNFLSLRTKSAGSHFPSFPQREIEMVALRMEDEFALKMPITATLFHQNGRVAP